MWVLGERDGDSVGFRRPIATLIKYLQNIVGPE